MSKSVDETEHSLEMHVPFIKKVFGDKEIQLIPIMVGNLTKLKEIQYGDILSQYFRKDKNLFIISSDFCHWGMNFDFNYYNKEDGEIYQSIEKLDKQAIAHIEAHDHDSYDKYLKETENTICGRHPIGVLMGMIGLSEFPEGKTVKTKFIKYAQSEKVKKSSQTSVSYASSYTILK